MPRLLREGPYRFDFFSRENAEPPHVHASRDGIEAKFWLNPIVELCRNTGFADHEIRRIRRIVDANRDLFLRKWHEHFDD